MSIRSQYLKIKSMKDSELVQLYNPYASTIRFEKFLKQNNLLTAKTKKIIDIGSGIGSNLQYFSKKNDKIKFTCSDYGQKRISLARKLNKNSNIDFETLDILKLNKKFINNYDGLISIHALCCFKSLGPVIENMCKINPKWIAINSLFYKGNLDVLIHIRDHKQSNLKDDNPNSDFNIFSLSKLELEFKKNNYKLKKVIPYFPKKPIPKPKNNKRGSYTIKSDFNKYSTFSGPVYLPWHFILAKKNDDI